MTGVLPGVASSEVSDTVLDRIIVQTRVDVVERKRRLPSAALRDRIEAQQAPVDVAASLRQDHVAVIAEFKRASPSRGRFPVEIDPDMVATDYVAGGAAAISCLTDGPFFQGSLDDLSRVVGVAASASPAVGVLRKDFIVDPYQIEEARAWGASCILLIAAALDDALLVELYTQAAALGMASLIEVHDEPELARAMRLGATLIGVNNRDLKTLTVDLGVTERLAALAPADVILVGESGIASAADVERMAAAGVDAVLVGESIILQPDRTRAVAALAGVERRVRARG